MIYNKTKSFVLILGVLLFAFTGPVFAHETHHKQSELAQAMQQMEASFEQLEESIKDDSKAEHNLAETDKFIAAAQKASELEPPSAAHLEGEEKEQFLSRYSGALKAVVAEAEALRQMIEDGAPAQDRYQQLKKVYDHQKQGHDKFQEEE